MADIDAAPLPSPDPEPPARPGEFAAPSIGPIEVWPPVVLAPMAGVTNAPFRTLCRRYGAGIYVNQMITARALVEGHRKSLELAAFAPDESPRSIQLYGTDPYSIGEATRLLVDGLVDGIPVDHIDMNFGCPMKKVTRHGGGAASSCRMTCSGTAPLAPCTYASACASLSPLRPPACSRCSSSNCASSGRSVAS